MAKEAILHSNIIGEGKPFIILHGFLGMGDNWKTLGKQFSQQGHQIHLVDQRNHGRSFWSDHFNYHLLAKDLKQYCEHHHLNDIILLGHSMGGKTAMAFAAEFPDLVSKLIIADISPRFYPVHHEVILNGLSALDFNSIPSRSEADRILSNYVRDFGTRQFLLKNLYWAEKGKLGLRINLKTLKKEVAEIGEPLPPHAIFKKNVLFLRGDQSEYIHTDDEAIISHHFPEAEIKTIPKAGHWLHAENPKAFFEAVIKFLD